MLQHARYPLLAFLGDVAADMQADASVDLAAGMTPGPGSWRVLCLAIAGDIAIAVAKFVVAAVTGSSAMFTEGVHSLVDTGNELLLLYGVRSSQRVVEGAHPLGDSKTTYVWSLVVALSVFSIGGGVCVYQGIISLTEPPVLADPTWNYVVLAIAAVFQGWSWRVSQKELDSYRHAGESLWGASQRDMDVVVFRVFIEDSAALMGIAIAALGVALSHALKNPYFDPAASVLIGLLLIASAALLARKTVGLLAGASHHQLDEVEHAIERL